MLGTPTHGNRLMIVHRMDATCPRGGGDFRFLSDKHWPSANGAPLKIILHVHVFCSRLYGCNILPIRCPSRASVPDLIGQYNVSRCKD